MQLWFSTIILLHPSLLEQLAESVRDLALRAVLVREVHFRVVQAVQEVVAERLYFEEAVEGRVDIAGVPQIRDPVDPVLETLVLEVDFFFVVVDVHAVVDALVVLLYLLPVYAQYRAHSSVRRRSFLAQAVSVFQLLVRRSQLYRGFQFACFFLLAQETDTTFSVAELLAQPMIAKFNNIIGRS